MYFTTIITRLHSAVIAVCQGGGPPTNEHHRNEFHREARAGNP